MKIRQWQQVVDNPAVVVCRKMVVQYKKGRKRSYQPFPREQSPFVEWRKVLIGACEVLLKINPFQIQLTR
jgi:hypothetical protein